MRNDYWRIDTTWPTWSNDLAHYHQLANQLAEQET